MEYKVLENDQQYTRTQLALTWEEIVRVRRIIVIPIKGIVGRPVAIASIGVDLTPYINLVELFNLYRKYFDKRKAVKQLSKYLKLDRFFLGGLNCRELFVLLAMIQDPKHKQVASLLKLSPYTVESYLVSLKEKLKNNIDIYQALSILRDGQKWKIEPIDF